MASAWYQCTQRNGMRCSTAAAYLHPAMSRPNLKVITDALVDADPVRRRPGERRRGRPQRRPRGDPCRRGSDPLRRRVQFPAIVAPIRHRAGGGPGDAADPGAPGSARRDRVAGPPDGADELVHRYRDAHDRAERRERRPPAKRRPGAAHLELSARPAASSAPATGSRARRPVPRHARGQLWRKVWAAVRARLRLRPLRPQTDQPGQALSNANPFSKPRITHNYFAAPEDRQSMVEGIRIGLDIASGRR